MARELIAAAIILVPLLSGITLAMLGVARDVQKRDSPLEEQAKTRIKLPFFE